MNTNEIKIKAESLIAARLEYLESIELLKSDEEAYLDHLYSDSEHHTKTDMVEFFRSFDVHKETVSDIMKFNLECGFTSQYKDLMN